MFVPPVLVALIILTVDWCTCTRQDITRYLLKRRSSTTTTVKPENDQTFCTLLNFQKCISEFLASSVGSKPEGVSTSSTNDLAFPTTLGQLEVTCVDLKERVRCLDRHSERCFTQEMLQVFGHIVTNAKQFVHDLCDNKRVQTEYLIHAKCFRNISLDEQKCGQKYRDAISIPVEQNVAGTLSGTTDNVPQEQKFQVQELIMRRSCCALQELVFCKRHHVREQCGESAAIFMRDHLPRITNPVLEQHCSAYTYGPGTCNEALYGHQLRQQHIANEDGHLEASGNHSQAHHLLFTIGIVSLLALLTN